MIASWRGALVDVQEVGLAWTTTHFFRHPQIMDHAVRLSNHKMAMKLIGTGRFQVSSNI